MSGTQVLLVSLLLSPYVLLRANGRRVAPSSNDNSKPLRALRSLENVIDKYREAIASFKTHGGVDNSTEIETTFIYACLGLDDSMKTMETTIKSQTTRITELEKNYFDIKKALRDEIINNRKSEGIFTLRILEMQMKLNRWINQMDAQTISIAKLTLRALKEYSEHKDLQAKISKEKNEAKRTELYKLLREKSEKLRLAEEELIAAGGGSKLIIEIVKLQEKIRVLESKATDDSEEIEALRKELEEKLRKLEGSGDKGSTVVTQIITLQDEILQMYIRKQTLIIESKVKIAELEKQLSEKNSKLKSLRESSKSSAGAQIIVIEKEVHTIKNNIEAQKKKIAAQIKELENAIKNKNDLLEKKVKDLQEVQKTDYELIVKVITHQFQISKMQETECSGQDKTEAILTEIRTQLTAKEKEILNLEAKNRRLQHQLKEMSEECSGLQEKIKELGNLLAEQVNKVKGDLKPFLELISLKLNVQQIKMSIVAEKSATRIAELTLQLKEKEKEIKEKVKEITEGDLEGSQEVKIISLLMEMWELQTGVESEMTLDRLHNLQNDLNQRIFSLKDTTHKLLLAILAAQTDQTRIRRLKIIISEKYEVELLALNSRLERMERDLISKKAEIARKDQDISKLGKEITALQGQIENLKKMIEKLNKATTGHIEDLERQLKIRERELEDKTKEIKNIEKENGELVIRITGLVVKLKETEIKAYKKDQVLASKLSMLEKQLDILRKENSHIKDKNKALEQENEACSHLKDKYNELQRTTDELMKKVKESYKFILQINELTIAIENLRRNIDRKPDNTAELERLLKKKLKELEDLKRDSANFPGASEITKITEVIIAMNKEKHASTDKHLQHISELQELVDQLMNDLKKKTDENKYLVVQILTLKGTENMLIKEIAALKKQHAVTINSLQAALKEKEKRLEIETSKCDKLAAHLKELKEQISKLEKNLETHKEIYGAKVTELEENLKTVTEELQNAIAKLKIVEGENAKQVLKIIQLQFEMTAIVNKAVTEKQVLQDDIAALKKMLSTCTGEKDKLIITISELKANEKAILNQCSLLNDTFWEMKTEFDATITKVDETSQLIIKMNMLILETDALQQKIEGSTGDTTALEAELQRKIKELEKVENQLGLRNRENSKNIKKIIAILLLKQQQKQQKNINRYLQQIDELDKELDERTAALKGAEAENIKLLIKTMSLEEDMTSLQNQIAKTKRESSRTLKELEKQLELKYKEINELKAKDCGVNAMKGKIAEMEAEAKKLELELTRARQSAEDQIKELEKRLVAKKQELENNREKMMGLDNKNGELILKLIAMEKKMNTIISESENLENASATIIKDLREKLKGKGEENTKLQITITALERSKKDLEGSCATFKQQYTDLKTKVEEDMNAIENIPKLILRMNMLSINIESLKKQLESETGDKTELKKELEKEIKELEKVEKQLGKEIPVARQIKELIAVIRGRSTVNPIDRAEYLKRIAELESELHENIAVIKEEEAERIKAMIQVLEQQEEITLLKNRLSKVKHEASAKVTEIEDKLTRKQQEIDALKSKDCGVGEKTKEIAALEKEARELQAALKKAKESSEKEVTDLTKQLEKAEEDLKGSKNKLQSVDKEHGALIAKMIAMQDKMDKLLISKKDLKTETAEVIADLKEQLSITEDENAKLKAENEELGRKTKECAGLQEKISALEKNKQKVIDSCATIKEQYTDLKTKMDKQMEQIEDIPKLILRFNLLNIEIEKLKRAMESQSGDKTELNKELEKKMKELNKIEKELGQKSPAATQIKQLIAILREKSALNLEEPKEYLKRIAELEGELEETIASLQGEETEKIKAMIQVMEQQDEITQLKNRLSRVKEDSSKKIIAMESQLEKKRHEIDRMKVMDCGVGKRKKEIDALEREARDMESKLKQLKQSSEKEIADLVNRLKIREKAIKSTSEKLESLDKHNGALIIKTIEMQDKMDTLLNDKRDSEQKAAEMVADLKKQLQVKEQENAKLKAENKEIRVGVGKAKDCALLKAENEGMKKQLDSQDKDIKRLKREMEEAQEKLKADLKAQQETAIALEKEKKQLQKSLDKKEQENQELKKKVEDIKAAEDAEKAIHTIQPAIDPDTAHPKLQLSNNNKEMKLLVTARNVPTLKTRYDSVLGALAAIGFDKGRQYWEVLVAEKPCYVLGVSGETAPRKGLIGFQPRNQYWTLRMKRTGDLMALDKREYMARKRDSGKVGKIGVLLDFKKGVISFYDAGTRTHLYTFRNIEVKSKLFPFMSTCEDTDQGSPPMVFNSNASADWLKS